MGKITFNAEDLWIIRSQKTKPDGAVQTSYYMTPSTWTKAPTKATMFSDYDQGMGHVIMYQQRDAAPKGWADGSTEVFDVVPLHGEILHSPNAIKINIKKD